MIGRLLGRRGGRQAAQLLALTLLLCCLPQMLSMTAGAAGRSGTPLSTARMVPVGLLAAIERTVPASRTTRAVPPQAELTARDGAPFDLFGGSLALSGDGSVALVGATFHKFHSGAAYVFVQQGGWSLQAELTVGDGAPLDFFGGSLALSGDGSVALVGASGHNHRTGATYVFVRRGTSWRQQAELTARDGAARDQFGWAVALSGDGSTALVGADNHNVAIGAAYVFVQQGGWRQQAALTAGDGARLDCFGSALALSRDGTSALVGAIGHRGLSGVCYVFERSGTGWFQQAELAAGDGAPSDRFGYRAAVSGDGSTALVGAYFRHQNTGAAYIFVRSGTSWHQQAELSAADGAQGDQFGYSVALSSDGGGALVGANGRHRHTGAVYAFVRRGANWRQQNEFVAQHSTAHDGFGSAMALSLDSHRALVGADGKNDFAGAAYVFVRGRSGWGPQASVAARS